MSVQHFVTGANNNPVPVSAANPLPVTGGSGGATGPGTAASAGRVTYASDGATVPVTQGALTAATNRSGTATTTSGGLNVAANTSRRSLVGQNISTVSIGFNEFNGTAEIGTAGTYTVPAGSSFSIFTTNQVNFIAASGTAAITMTET